VTREAGRTGRKYRSAILPRSPLLLRLVLRARGCCPQHWRRSTRCVHNTDAHLLAAGHTRFRASDENILQMNQSLCILCASQVRVLHDYCLCVRVCACVCVCVCTVHVNFNPRSRVMLTLSMPERRQTRTLAENSTNRFMLCIKAADTKLRAYDLYCAATQRHESQ
jgi:hypothetical protein